MRRRALCFIIPAHGRLEIAKVCLRQLVRTCEALEERAIVASAVVIADDENLDIARELGFATVERDNSQLGRKINDGYELASMHGAEYFVPFGSDDWIDHNWIRLPSSNETICTHLSSVVNEDCTKIARLDIRFGDGVRVYGRKTLERVGFRPAAEDRKRALDAATDSGVSDTGARKVFHDTDYLAIVDFKSKANLNNYKGCAQHYGNRNETGDVWTQLASVYPSEAITEMQAVHGLVPA